MTSVEALQTQSNPTMYFIGVTTGKSAIMHVFPKWAEVLGITAQLIGYDCPLHAPADDYLAIVRHIQHDPLSMGALVTTHKIDLLAATQHLFDELDAFSALCGEVSCISKREGQLRGHAKDPISSGLAWQGFVPKGHWAATGGHVLCLGAGGAATAISVFAANEPNPAERPQKFIAVDRSSTRLEELKAVHAKLHTAIEFEYILSDDPHANDKLLAALPSGSMVINATGMGKDRAGSPITDAGIFPESGLVWELNYRGELDFMQQARRQAAQRHLIVEDGWVYFLHGWTQVIAEVFNVGLTPTLFAQLDSAASALRPQTR